MERKIFKAQAEVWDWKESLYRELESIPRNSWVEYLVNLSKDTIKTLEDKKKEKRKVITSEETSN